jgi:predicted ABC-type ATPase
MVVVAGPAGSGKSRHFPVDSFGCHGFNIDLRAAAQNGGSFHAIPPAVRLRAQKECEAFVMDHIARGESFAVETTLRSSAAIEQARQAGSAGFETLMVFVCAGEADECVRRVRIRGLGGGHAAPEAEIRDIHARSLSNLVVAVEVFERIEIYDNCLHARPVTSGCSAEPEYVTSRRIRATASCHGALRAKGSQGRIWPRRGAQHALVGQPSGGRYASASRPAAAGRDAGWGRGSRPSPWIAATARSPARQAGGARPRVIACGASGSRWCGHGILAFTETPPAWRSCHLERCNKSAAATCAGSTRRRRGRLDPRRAGGTGWWAWTRPPRPAGT